MNHPGFRSSKPRQHIGVKRKQSLAEDTGQLAFGARRIEQRTEHIENGRLSPLGKQFAGRSDGFEGGMETRCEQKYGACLTEHFLQPRDREIHRHA